MPAEPVRVEEMTELDIERAIVDTIAEFKRRSCIRDQLGRLVLRHLGVVLRRGRRQDFESRLSKAVKHLRIARAPIVRVYKATTNIRIGLIDGYEEKFRRRFSYKRAADRRERARRRGPLGNADGHLRDSADGAAGSGVAQTTDETFDASELDDLLSDEPPVDEDWAVPTFEPPDLPDDDDEEELADFPDDDTDVADEDGEEDTERKLGRLFGHEDEPPERPAQEGAAPAPLPRLSTDDVLAPVQEVLERTPGLAVERRLNQLVVLANPAGGIEIELSLRYSPSEVAAYAQVLLPYREEAMLPLLELAGAPDFNSIIGTRMRRQGATFVVRRIIPLARVPIVELPDLVVELIGDARRAAELLGG